MSIIHTHTNQLRSRSIRLLITTIVAMLTVLGLTATTAMAAQPASPAPASPAPTPGTSWDSLRATAQKDGTVPVIVGLAADTSAPTGAVDKTPGKVKVRQGHEEKIRGVRSGLERKFKGKLPKGYRSGEGAPFVTMRVSPAELETLRTSGEVSAVSLDETRDVAGTSSYGSAAGQQLASQWDFTRIGANWANTNGWTGKGMYVAVIDTGVDRTNPYLSGRVANEACFATNTNGTGACPGGTTARYSTTSAAGITSAATPCAGNYYSYSCAHGTHVAHTAAGAYGVARGAKVIAINASHMEYDAVKKVNTPRFSDSDVIWGLWYIDTVLPKLGIVAAAVNLSIGGGGYTGYCDSTATTSYAAWINKLRSDYQIPVVVSSGNDNYYNGVSSPACNSTAISVGNTTLASGVDAVYGGVTGGSNSNSTLDLLAPGTDICSAVPKVIDADGSADGWQCGWIGTSMAAPQVAGAIAILTQKRPTATVADFQAALSRSGSTGGVAVTDSRNNITRTRINVANAVYYF